MQKVAIIAAFSEFRPGYSLTGIVKDQCRMLLDWGHEPHLFVREKYNREFDADMPTGVVIHEIIPKIDQIDYQSAKELTPEHNAASLKFRDSLVSELQGFEIAFCHDLIFQGWYYPFGLGVQRATLALPNMRWLHWIHSIPTQGRDWWDMKKFGSRHKIVYPNKTDAVRVMESYKTTLDSIRVIPHIKDLRGFFDFDPVTCKILHDHPALMQADIVQVYPASADRLSSKNVDKLIRIFGAFKERGFTTGLLIADQWATETKHREEEQTYIDLAKSQGLTEEEVMFSSRFGSQFKIGLPKRILRELMLCSNLFVFPTTHETFGLAGPEAALAGAFIVTNRSLYMQGEIWDHLPLGFDFGSYHGTFNPEGGDWDGYLHAVADVIAGRMSQNENTMTRTLARQKYNWDALYHKHYQPTMEEAKRW